MIDKFDLSTKANQLRQELGEDDRSPIDIFAVVQSIEGLTLVFYPMGSNLSGMFVRTGSNKCVIAINSTMTLGRQRFSVAHELYHMYYDSGLTASICFKKIGEGNETEKKADCFASFFLMPEAAMKNKVKMLKEVSDEQKISIGDIIRLEQYFGVSHQAMIIRLKESDLIDSQQETSFNSKSVKAIASRLGYDTALYSPLPEEKTYRTFGAYVGIAEKLLKKDLISVGKYEEYLLDAFREDIVYGYDEDGDVVD